MPSGSISRSGNSACKSYRNSSPMMQRMRIKSSCARRCASKTNKVSCDLSTLLNPFSPITRTVAAPCIVSSFVNFSTGHKNAAPPPTLNIESTFVVQSSLNALRLKESQNAYGIAHAGAQVLSVWARVLNFHFFRQRSRASKPLCN